MHRPAIHGPAGPADQPAAVPTLDDVAAIAGVSRATASRVINGSPEVAAQTRHRVRLAVDQLGYVPNTAAQTLAGRRAGALALVAVEPALLPDRFVAGVLRGAAAAIAAAGLDCLLSMVHGRGDRARVEASVRTGRVGGGVLVASEPVDLVDSFRRRLLPVTLVTPVNQRAGGPTPDEVGADAVRAMLGEVIGARPAPFRLAVVNQ